MLGMTAAELNTTSTQNVHSRRRQQAHPSSGHRNPDQGAKSAPTTKRGFPAMSQFRTRRGVSALLLTAAGVAITAAMAVPVHAAGPIKARIVAIQGGNGMATSGTTARDVFQFDGSGGTITVSSSTGPVSAGAGCTQVGTSAVRCSGVVLIQAFGGSGNDNIRNNTAVPMGVNGQSDNDTLIGGPGRDTLNGGFGSDFANGRGGRDTCAAETVVSCEEVTS